MMIIDWIHVKESMGTDQRTLENRDYRSENVCNHAYRSEGGFRLRSGNRLESNVNTLTLQAGFL